MAVAENQPSHCCKNRMTSSLTFSDLATQLRDFIGSQSTPAGLLGERKTVLPLRGERGGVRASVVSNKPEAEFNQLGLSLFAVQFAHNPPFRRFCESRQVSPDTVEQWSQIPAVPAIAFKEFELTSLPEARRTRVFHSSGTTVQRPGRHFHDAESLSLYEASLLPWFQTHLLPEFSPAVPQAESLHASVVFQRAIGTSPSPGGPQRAKRASQIGHLNRGGLGKPLGRGEGEQFLSRSSVCFLSLTPPPELAPHSSLVHMFATIHRQCGSADSVFAVVF